VNSKSLRVIIPNFAAPDSFVDNVATTLRQMGHDVLTLPAVPNRWLNSPLREIGRHVLAAVAPHHAVPEERWLLKAARRARPDLVLSLTQSVSDDTLVTLNHANLPDDERGRVHEPGWNYCFNQFGERFATRRPQ